MIKYNVKDLERALEFFKKKGAQTIQLRIDDNFRLNMSMSVDANGNGITVTLYSTNKDDDSLKMPEVTETRRL